jgi:CheY-like chemotaxis protein
MPNEMRDIVVVDDNPMLLIVLSEIFSERGYSVRAASDGFTALAAIKDRIPDILISDLNIPGMSGFELLSVVRRRFPTIAVIAMSGGYSGVAACSEIAADGFYAKGSSSVAALFTIMAEIDDEEARESRRAMAPIWIPGLPAQQGDISTTALARPECLRVFSHSLRTPALRPQESCCPHCLNPVQFAIVRPPGKMDHTHLLLSA